MKLRLERMEVFAEGLGRCARQEQGEWRGETTGGRKVWPGQLINWRVGQAERGNSALLLSGSSGADGGVTRIARRNMGLSSSAELQETWWDIFPPQSFPFQF